MIIDFHTHIFPEAIRVNRERYFPAEPAFKLLYNSTESKLSGVKNIIDTMDEQGVDISVIFGFPWETADTFKMHNDYIIDAVVRYPKRLVGLGCFDLLTPGAQSEAERCIENGLSGIGELAFYQSIMDDTILTRLEPIMAILRNKNLPILIHTNEPIGHPYFGKADMTIRQIDNLVSRFPNNTIVLAHWGGGLFYFYLLKKQIKEHLTNVYFDTAASPFLYDSKIYPVAVEILGPQKILFGSDYPLLNPQRYFNEIRSTGLSKDDIQCICGLNAARLLKLDRVHS